MRVGDEVWPDPDLNKPNHYAHDILGDPYTCTDGGHNHPPKFVRKRETAPRWLRVMSQLVLFTALCGAIAVILLVVYALAAMVI